MRFAKPVYAEIPGGSKLSWIIGEDELTEYTSAKGMTCAAASTQARRERLELHAS